MNMVLLCPSRAPIIVIHLSKRRSEWIAWPSVSLVARFRRQTRTTRKKSLSMNTSTYGELCAWFDSIGDSVCVSIDTNCHSHHYHQHGSTEKQAETANRGDWSQWKCRRLHCFFLRDWKDETSRSVHSVRQDSSQYWLIVFTNPSCSVHHALRTSEGRPFNTSPLIISLARMKGGLNNDTDWEKFCLDEHLFTIN